MPKKIILLYGLPCSGKSSVIKALSECNRLAVDDGIKDHVSEPSIDDFKRLSKILVNELYSRIVHSGSNCYVIEMGCLIQRAAIEHLENEFNKIGIEFINIMLHAQDEVLLNRIIKRNRQIARGLSDSFPVEGPDYLTRFKEVFEKNKPVQSVDLDTSQLDPQRVLFEVKRIVNAANEN